MIGIYKITSPEGKVYIGCSSNIEKRWKSYSHFESTCSNQKKLYDAFKKYGFDKHIFEVIEECSLDILLEREAFWIKYFNSFENGLNMNKGGYGCVIHSDSTRNKIKQARTGWIPSPERGIIIGNKLKNKPKSEEHKQKISLSNLGKPKPFKGRVSPNKGNKYTSEVIQTIRESRIGTKMSLSSRKQMSDNQWKKRKVNQYDLEGNFIKEWSSVTEAKKHYKGDIGACCRGKQKTAGGYIWKFV